MSNVREEEKEEEGEVEEEGEEEEVTRRRVKVTVALSHVSRIDDPPGGGERGRHTRCRRRENCGTLSPILIASSNC